MSQNNRNQKEKNLILAYNPSDRGLQSQVPGFYSRNSSLSSQFGLLSGNGLGRQSSAGNLFMTFHTNQKPKEEPNQPQEKLTQSQKYAQACLQYQKYHFDDRIKLIIHRMAIKAYSNIKDKSPHEFLSFSIQKLLGIISKKLLLNRFQLLFLQYVFQQTKWEYDIPCIKAHVQDFRSYAHLSEEDGSKQATKKLEIYLLYCSFYSKKSLNDFPKENIYNCYLKSICLKWKDDFQEWTQKSKVSNIKINPKTLNNIFKRLTFYADRNQQQIQNYNLLVEQIIEISPAYNNSQKSGTKKRKTGKQKKEEDLLEQIKQQQNQIIHEEDYDNQQLDIPPVINKKQTSYISNLDDMDPQKYIQRNIHKN